MHKMKTIEEKAKAYDEALEIAKQFYYDESTRVGMTPIDIERMFPVLKESEDEKIRHFLISKMKEVGNVWKEYSAKDIVAWLEKQGKLVNEYEDKLDRCACENFNKGYEAAIKRQKEKQGEQKPVSITDEWIEDYWQHEKVNNPYSYDKGEEIQFDHQEFVRFCKKYCKNPAEWSEEDNRKIKFLVNLVNEWCDKAPNATSMVKEEMSDWLKSLKDRVFPQNAWKPSDELIQALERSADYLHDYGKNDDDLLLLRLLEELKKLKE